MPVKQIRVGHFALGLVAGVCVIGLIRLLFQSITGTVPNMPGGM